MVSLRTVALTLVVWQAFLSSRESLAHGEACWERAKDISARGGTLLAQAKLIAAEDTCLQATREALKAGGYTFATVRGPHREGLLLFIGVLLSIQLMMKKDFGPGALVQGMTALTSLMSSTVLDQAPVIKRGARGRFASTA